MAAKVEVILFCSYGIPGGSDSYNPKMLTVEAFVHNGQYDQLMK